MKTKPKLERQNDGGTLVDVLVIVAVAVLAAAIFLPSYARPKRGGQRIACINNQKQVSTGLRLFANDNDGRYLGLTRIDGHPGGGGAHGLIS